MDWKTEQLSDQLLKWGQAQAWDGVPMGAWSSLRGLYEAAHPIYSFHNQSSTHSPSIRRERPHS